MTLNEFRSILLEQQQSGLSQREFCDQKSMKISTFGYWMRKIKAEDLSPSEFIQITEIPISEKLELHTSGKITMTIHPGFDERKLLRIINTLLS